MSEGLWYTQYVCRSPQKESVAHDTSNKQTTGSEEKEKESSCTRHVNKRQEGGHGQLSTESDSVARKVEDYTNYSFLHLTLKVSVVGMSAR